MNHGHGRERIFSGNKNKSFILSVLAAAAKKMNIPILAYCILSKHYHLVVENSSGRMAVFFKLLNGEYAITYRGNHGGLKCREIARLPEFEALKMSALGSLYRHDKKNKKRAMRKCSNTSTVKGGID